MTHSDSNNNVDTVEADHNLAELTPVSTPQPATHDLAMLRRQLIPDLTIRQTLADLAIVFGVAFGGRILDSYLQLLAQAGTTGESGTLASDPLLVYAGATVGGIIATALVLYVVHARKQSLSRVGLHGISITYNFAAAVPALIGIYAVQILLTLILWAIAPDLVNRASQERMQLTTIFQPVHPWFLLRVCIWIGFYEELVFRGFLLPRIRRLVGNWPLAILLASVLFGAAHPYQGVLGMVQIAIVAAVLSTIFVWRASLWPVVIAHTIMNFVSLLLLPYLEQANELAQKFLNIITFGTTGG